MNILEILMDLIPGIIIYIVFLLLAKFADNKTAKKREKCSDKVIANLVGYRAWAGDGIKYIPVIKYEYNMQVYEMEIPYSTVRRESELQEKGSEIIIYVNPSNPREIYELKERNTGNNIRVIMNIIMVFYILRTIINNI